MSGLSADKINEDFRIMLDSLPIADSNTTLKIANSILHRNGFQIKQPFLDINTAFFKAEIRSLDFSGTGAVDTINNWCALNTNNLIKEVISKIPDMAMMYLINGVYSRDNARDNGPINLINSEPIRQTLQTSWVS